MTKKDSRIWAAFAASLLLYLLLKFLVWPHFAK